MPVIPIPEEHGYGLQLSSKNGDTIKAPVQGQLEFIKKKKDADTPFKTLIHFINKWRKEQELDKFCSLIIELIVAHLYDRDGVTISLESGLQRFYLYVPPSELKTQITFPEL